METIINIMIVIVSLVLAFDSMHNIQTKRNMSRGRKIYHWMSFIGWILLALATINWIRLGQ